MAEELLPQEYNVPMDLPGEELNARIDPVEGYLPPVDLSARPRAIDIYDNAVGNPIKGSNPVPTSTGLDFANQLVDKVNKQVGQSKETDQYYKMRPYTYSGDYDAANFDRYYGTNAYKTLGFSPYRDNESLYNDKMTFGDQFTRSFSQWDNLLWTGFKSGVKTWGDIFTDPIAPDLQSAKEMQKAMAIGSINTGGVGGFIGNTILNGAYGIGIGLEFLAEEAALAAATAFTGGLLGEATAPAMLSRGALFAKQLGKIGEYGAKLGGKTAEYAKSFEKGMEAFKVAENVRKAGKGIDKATDAIDGVNSARNFFNKAVSGAFDLVNPFDETFASLKSTQYASNLAKTIGTSGAFIDDIIRIKTAASEAKLEGGMVQIDATKKLIDQYREEHGVDPTGEDLTKIETLARLEGERTVLYNYPAIMATNKLLFSTILYPLTKIKGGPTSKLIYNTIVEGDVKATSQNIFKKLGTSPGAQIKAAAKSLLKPKVYGTYGMNYLKANIAEGAQENIQEAISQGAIEHALAVQKDPGMAAFHGYSGYLMKGLQDQLSAQGAETFASGFLMGMFTQPILTAPTWAMTKGIERLRSKEVRDKIKEQRDAAADAEANTLNDLANNDLGYWFSDAGTTVKNNALNTDMLNQASIGDVKGARDSQFAIEFHHMAAMHEGGRFEILMDKLKDYKNLSPKEALEAFKRYNIGIETEADAEAALKHIDSVVDRAYRMKEQFEAVASKFPNFYKLSGLSPNTPEYTAMAISYRAWQEAQRNLVFAKSAFDEYGRRSKSIMDGFASMSAEIAKTDAQTLQSLMTMPNLKMEISTLKREISALGEVEGQAEVKRDKQKKLDLLQNFQESIQQAQEKIASEKITDYLDKQAVYGQAKKDFQKLMTYLAKKNDTILFNEQADEAFQLLTDNLEMRDEMQGLAHSVNVLSSPKGFFNLQKRIFEALDKEARSENRLERIRENIYRFHALNDENEIFNALGKLGLKLPDEFIEEYRKALEEGKDLPTPDRYEDPSTGKDVDYLSDGDRYLKADELWQAFRYWMQETRKKKPEEIEAERKKAQDALTAMQFDPKVLESFPPMLAENLKAMHLADIESGDIAKDMTLKEYVETNPKALEEIKLYKMQVAQQTDWVDLIDKAVSEKELNAVMDQIDKLNAMTPDLLTTISKKRDSFSATAPATSVDNKDDIDILAKAVMTLPFSTIQNLGNLLSTKGAFKEMEDLADVIAKVYYDGTNPELIKAVDDALDAAREKQMAEGLEFHKQSIIDDIERRRREELFGNLTQLEFETTDTKGRTRKTTLKTKVDENGFKYSFETTVDGKSSTTSPPKVSKEEFKNSSIYENLDQDSKDFIDELPDDAVIVLQSIAISTDANSAAGLGNGNITIGYISKSEGGRLDDIVLKYQPNKINAKYDAELAALEEKPVETTEEIITETYDKPWRDDKTKVNKATSFALKNKPDEKFELVEDLEPGYYSVHFKTTGKDALTSEEKQKLIQAIADAIPDGGKLSTWGELTKGALSGLNRFKNAGFNESGESREVTDREGNPLTIPVLIKGAVEKKVETPEKKEVRKKLFTEGFPFKGGRRVVWNKELKTWDFYTKGGKRIINKKELKKLTTELSNDGGFIRAWWDDLLTEEDRQDLREIFENYRYLGLSEGESKRQDVEDTKHIILMQALQGAKFKKESEKPISDYVTDIGKTWLTSGKGFDSADEFVNESLSSWYSAYNMNLPDDTSDLISDVYAMLNEYPEGINDKAIKEYKESITGSPLIEFAENFTKDYGLDLDLLQLRLYDLEEKGRLDNPITEKVVEPKDEFNTLSIPQKFNDLVKELSAHNILSGKLTADFKPLPDQGVEYTYQVTLDDGRTVPVGSAYYFNSDIPTDLYKNQPQVRLVLAEFNGEPAIEVRVMEPNHMDQLLTYVRKEPLKYTKPLGYDRKPSQEEIESLEVRDVLFYQDMTLEEMNKNISEPVLKLVKLKGYDVIYQNSPYLVTSISGKNVSLRSLDGKAITVPITDITEIRDGKGIIKNIVDIEMAKINQAAADSALSTLDDTVSLDAALKSVKVNKCNDATNM